MFTPPQTTGVTETFTVCQVLHSLNVGGAEVLAARLARQLRDACRFVFVCLEELGTLGEELRSESFTVDVLGRKPGLDGRCALRLAQHLRRHRVDLIHAHQYTPFFYSLLARLIFDRPAVLFTEHGRHSPDYRRPKRVVANRLLLQRRDRVVGVGQAVRTALINHEGLPAQRVGVIYNGVDTAGIGNSTADRDAVRREIGVDPGDFVVLLVARLDYLKDHATALRTLRRAVAHQPKVRLVLAGEGPERGAIEQTVQQLDLAANVRFLGLRKDVARLLKATDMFLLTSISEGIPLTVIEAMAAGLPVLATRVGGLAELVEDGQSGFLAPPRDDATLADRLLRLAGDANLRHAFGRRGQERAQTLFTENLMHARYLELYRSMHRS
jgi:glycosyltransferase involved in cell wall biosynthesis